MLNMNEIDKIIWNLLDCLHGLIFSSDRLSGAVVRLLFLKYAVDNSLGATDIESVQLCAKAQKMFARRDTEGGLDTIIPFLENIDRAYRLDKIISSDGMIEHYAGELFGMDRTRQKKNVNDQGFKRVMDMLGSLDLEEEKGSHEIGRMLVDALVPMMSSSMERLGKIAGENMTGQSLAKLAKAILNVSGHDTFCDFVAGNGISTIEITRDWLPEVILSDISREATASSAMLLIMYGYPRFKVICGDSLRNRLYDIRGNKIFADLPFGMRLDKTGDNRYTDGTLTAIDRLLHEYLEDGTAVVTCPSGPLYRQGPATGLKDEMVSLGLLHAVVALPPMWSGISVGTNLLVFGRIPSFNVLFVDATDQMQTTEKKRARTANTLTDEAIEKIIEVINNPRDIPGFAKVVFGSEIRDKEFNLIPANYVVRQSEEDTTTLAEIDDQLAELYRQLNL